MMYDGPVPPRGIFDDFLNMTSLRLDVKERSFVDLIKSTRLSVMSTAGSRSVDASLTFRLVVPNSYTY